MAVERYLFWRFVVIGRGQIVRHLYALRIGRLIVANPEFLSNRGNMDDLKRLLNLAEKQLVQDAENEKQERAMFANPYRAAAGLTMSRDNFKG